MLFRHKTKASKPFQLTAARRRLGRGLFVDLRAFVVSTHSRPKAAGLYNFGINTGLICFNSQPPEGGWALWGIPYPTIGEFQLTAARRRLGGGCV